MSGDNRPTAADADESGGRAPTVGSLVTLNRALAERLFVLVLLAYLGYFLAMTMTYGPQARLLPLTIGIPTVLLLVTLLVRPVYDARVADDSDDAAESVDDEAADPAAEATATPGVLEAYGPLVRAIAWVVVLFALVMAVGILVGGFVFLIAFYRLQTDLSWPRIAIYTGVVTAFLWFVFLSTLKVPIDQGLLFTLL